MLRNSSTIYAGCDPAVQPNAPQTGQIFDTQTGDNIALPHPAIAAGEKLMAQGCAVATTNDGKQRVIYLLTTKTPSQGLTPESQQTNLIAFDPSTPQPTAKKPFSPPAPGNEVDANWSIYPAEGGFVVVHWSGPDLISVAFFDPNTLETKAHLEVALNTDTGIRGINYDGYAVQNAIKGPTYTTFDLHFHSGADGTEVGTFRNLGNIIAVDHGFLLEHNVQATPKAGASVDPADLAPGVFYFDMRTRDITGPIAPYLDMSQGMAPSPTIPALAEAFTYGDTIILAGSDSRRGGYLKIFDTAAKKEVFGLSDQQISGLKISDADIGGNLVYLKNESDNPVIDYRTSKTMSAGWSVRPLAKLDGGWVLLRTEGPKTSTGSNTLCVGSYSFPCGGGGATAMDRSGAYLARGATGDYDGPWF